MHRAIPVSLALLLVGGCAAPRARFIPPPVPTIDFISGTDFIITAPYGYRIGSTNKVIEVPQGFVTDYASIPPWLQGFLARQGRYSRAAVVHDYLYWSQICTKEQADNLFLIAMKELGVRKSQRTPIYDAVSWWGSGAWTANAKERVNGLPKVVPQNEYGLATSLTWPQARRELVKAGVHDPVFPQNPEACALGNSKDVP